ncbi:MAG: NAD(P)H-hydrate dehydratase [Chthoniobacterales bacterium]
MAEMRAAEDAAFARGVTAEALMDEAAAGIAATILKFFPQPGRCIVFAGKGNNAGDAFAAAAVLHSLGWRIELWLAFPENELGELAAKKFRVIQREEFVRLTSGRTIVLDGLLGLGAKPPPRDPVRAACREINRLRREENAFVIAVDLPTGLDGDTGDTDTDCVIADVTITIGAAKRGLIADRALNLVGRLHLVTLSDLALPNESPDSLIATPHSLRHLLPRRDFGAYKNQFGRIGVVAGSKGFVGAALMCSLGALRGGAGLVELFVPEDIYPIVASAAAPEIMVKPIRSYRDIIDEPIDVWAVGPGVGRANSDEIRDLITRAAKPMVVDADGLNILSDDTTALKSVGGPRLLTPHPGEMKRLFPLENVSRAEHARRFCDEFGVALLFKGSRTIVAERSKPISYNTTGNPGMATGGMGDVLTGVCAALIGQKLSPYDAARVGAWVCGRAAELAIFNGSASEQSLLPSDILAHLGRAFRELQT